MRLVDRRYWFLFLFVMIATIAMPVLAWAQDPSPVPLHVPGAQQPFTAAVILVSTLSMALGVLTQIVQTGKVLGEFTVPPKVMVWLMIVLPGVSAFYGYLHDQNPLVLNASTFFFASISALTAISSGAAPGAVVRVAKLAHFDVPDQMAQARAARKLAASKNGEPKVAA